MTTGQTGLPTEAALPTTPYVELEATLESGARGLSGRRSSLRAVRRRGWLVRRALATADVIGLTAAYFLAVWLFGGDASEINRIGAQREALLFLLTLPGWVLAAKLYGLYDRDEERTDHSTTDDFGGVFHLITVGTFLLLAGAWVTNVIHPNPGKLIAFWLLAIAFVGLLRATARAYCRRQIEYLQNTLIVGAGDVGQLIAKKYRQHPEYGINLVGLVEAGAQPRRGELGMPALLGGPERLPELIDTLDVERVVVAFPTSDPDDLLRLVQSVRDLGVQVDVVPRLFEIISPGVTLHTVEGVPLLALPPTGLTRSSQLLKRSLDVLLSVAVLIVLMPLLLLIALAIKLDSRGPVFFRQVRMGCGDRTFRIFKFRSMVPEAEAVKGSLAHLNVHAEPGGDPRMFKIADDPRITRVGRVLRRLALDELPQLMNVLAGDMSLVGPRPLILDEDSEVRAWARRRLDLKPGITGLWQVLGNSGISFEEMVKLDYLYVTSWSLLGDLKIMARTLPVIARTRRAL